MIRYDQPRLSAHLERQMDREQYDYSDMPPPIAPEFLRHLSPPRPQALPADLESMPAHAHESLQDHSAYSTAPDTPRELNVDSYVYRTADSQSRGSPPDREANIETLGAHDGPAEPERMDIPEPAPFPQLDP
ncbi:hypothetical protein PENSPDRAFT_455674 [Peniophora sp. CONT]|nr:hypothetical protein PENSPDRAFT_455674 [Peniophora sp. CONT]